MPPIILQKAIVMLTPPAFRCYVTHPLAHAASSSCWLESMPTTLQPASTSCSVTAPSPHPTSNTLKPAA